MVTSYHASTTVPAQVYPVPLWHSCFTSVHFCIPTYLTLHCLLQFPQCVCTYLAHPSTPGAQLRMGRTSTTEMKYVVAICPCLHQRLYLSFHDSDT